MGVELTDVFAALQAYLGSYYVNDFNRFGRTWQVNVQADAAFRADAQTVKQLKVRNADGDMVPLGAVANVNESAGPVQLTRYNMFPAAAISGASLPGVSTGDVLSTMERLAEQELPQSMTYEWTELSYLQKLSSRIESFRDLQQNPFSAFALGVVLVFFVLAGLYESWSLPLSVILVVPLCLSSALLGIGLAGMDVNIFVQVGFVVLVGLAAKNAILIVEFARDRQHEGASIFEAAVEAARVRLRPIIMTSLAFILGVFPLVIAQGAGAEMRRTLGTAVFSGMIGVTLFGIFLTPVFFYVIRRLFGAKGVAKATGRRIWREVKSRSEIIVTVQSYLAIQELEHEDVDRVPSNSIAVGRCSLGGDTAGLAAISRPERFGRRGRREARRLKSAPTKTLSGKSPFPAGSPRPSSPVTCSSSRLSKARNCTRLPTAARTARKRGVPKRRPQARGVSQDRRQPGRFDSRHRRQAHRLLLRFVRPGLLRLVWQGALEVRIAAGRH